MSFKCSIPGVSLKVFGRAIHSLSKIGDELYFEPREDGLFLRSVNSSRSAYACFQFSPSFFLHYVDVSGPEGAHVAEDKFRCKLGMKSIMVVFRNLATIDKTVEKCGVSLLEAEDRLVFKLYCRHGIIKTHKLAFIECETLQAVSSVELCPNKITSLPKLLCDAVLNFQANQEEITLVVRHDYLALQNYVDDDQDSSKTMRTEMTLSPGEFDQYDVGTDADVTFCLKELRAILSFADVTNLPLTLHFESAGSPITFTITGDLSYEATFVLATLADADEPQTQPGTQGQGQKQTRLERNGLSEGNNNNCHLNGSNKEQDVRRPKHRNKSRVEATTQDRDEETGAGYSSMSASCVVEDISVVEHHLEKGTFGSVSHARRDDTSKSEGLNGWGDEGYDTIHVTSNLNSHKHQSGGGLSDARQPAGVSGRDAGLDRDLSGADNHDEVGSQIIPDQNADLSIGAERLANGSEEDEDDDEIPATPPSKKFCSVFFGTQSSTQPSQSQSKVAMLAPASDDEDD